MQKPEIVKVVPSQGYDKAIATTAQHYQTMVAFVQAQMQKDIDYGTIPGTKKPTLLKAGAEKLIRLFNLRPHMNLLDSVVDFEKPLFYYHYRCSLYRGEEMVGEADGCCNSMENKYKKQQYRIFDLTNTICKIAQKRASFSSRFVELWRVRIFYSGHRGNVAQSLPNRC